MMNIDKKSGASNGLITIAAIALLLAHMNASRGETIGLAQAHRPNVLLIVVDDLGYGELGCYGGKEIPTPHLDALAGEGVRFTNGYVTAPFCAASRAALMTGRYQTRFGFEFNPIGARNAEPGVGLPAEEKTIANRMRDAGYATGLVGKWHLGGTPTFHPQRRGFDEFYGFLHEGHYYLPPPWHGMTTWLRRRSLPDGGKGRWASPDGRIHWTTHLNHNEPDYDADNPLLRNSQPIDEKSDLTSAFTREACDFIVRHRSQPFFLCAAYNTVHSPMQATDAYMARFAQIEDIHRRIFAAMLSQFDDSIGELMAQLRSSGLEDNTLIIFLSDNGGPTRELTSSNAPLRGGKGNLWEGGIRVPFMMSWKGKSLEGHTFDGAVSSLDIPATMLDIASIDTADTILDGVSLRPLLTENSKSSPHQSLFWRVGNKRAIRHGDWKLVQENTTDWQLFDLQNDIGESTDLARKQPQLVRDLAEMWERWNLEQSEPLWR